MAKKPEAKATKAATKSVRAAKTTVPTITVLEADKRPHDELMKLPKAQILREMAVPENKTRFMVDVDNQTAQGKQIIGLMEFFGRGDAVTIKTFTEILRALAGMVAKKASSEN